MNIVSYFFVYDVFQYYTALLLIIEVDSSRDIHCLTNKLLQNLSNSNPKRIQTNTYKTQTQTQKYIFYLDDSQQLVKSKSLTFSSC